LGGFRDRACNGNGRRPRQHPADSGYCRRTRLPQGQGIRRFALYNPNANRLKLKLTHRSDLNDETSPFQREGRNLRLYALSSAFSNTRYFLTMVPPMPSIAPFIGLFVSRIQPVSPAGTPSGLAASRCLR